MSFRIVRNDITQMNTEAIVNTANHHPTVGTGCDSAVYRAAGYEELLSYREEKIGDVPEGEVFLTPGFHLKAKYIIHAVSPLYRGGGEGEEELLRSCYRKSLNLAKETGITSVAFPLISTGGFGYPKEEGMRIAVDEIHAFLLDHDMDIVLVVFDDRANTLGRRIDPGLKEYIDRHYVENRGQEEYGSNAYLPMGNAMAFESPSVSENATVDTGRKPALLGSIFLQDRKPRASMAKQSSAMAAPDFAEEDSEAEYTCFEPEHESRLQERMRHLSDTFSQYLLYLIREKNMENAEVYKRAIVDKKIFSKIKNNPDYHPQKLTALCLCVGAKLNLDESKDLLARAGYALSPCDKTDIIFSYFIENEIYDMIELDIQLEEHGLPCIIS